MLLEERKEKASNAWGLSVEGIMQECCVVTSKKREICTCVVEANVMHGASIAHKCSC